MGLKVTVRSLIVLSIVLVAVPIKAENHRDEPSNVCPKMCTCDMVDELKRADCSHENLINAHTDVPMGVEILDLSVNKISSIEKDDFKGYEHLIKLFLSENSLHTIAFNAFQHLSKLQILDLSHNRLEQLHENLFEFNEQLVELDLSNNNFMNLQNTPFLNSPSIMHLDLSGCKIPQLYDSMFLHMPKIVRLDLSENLMITLPKEPFVPLKKLRVVDLHENRWQCDNSPVRSTISWMKRRIDSIQIENCFINPYKSKAKFEKMELDPTFQNDHDQREEVPIDKVWSPSTTESYLAILNEKSCAYSDQQDAESRKTCVNFVECQKRLSELYYAYVEVTQRKEENRSLHSRLTFAVLLSGIFIGALFGSFVTYSLMYLVGKCRKRGNPSRPPQPQKTTREMRREFRERNNFEHTRLSESPPPHNSNRQTISNLSNQEQSQIYSNHENTRQFLVNLFSKREPRYVRSNSQLSNLNNRYLPPTPVRQHSYTRYTPSSPAAYSTASFVWQSTTTTGNRNESSSPAERDPMLPNVVVRPQVSRQSSSLSVWNNCYGTDEVRRSESPGSASGYQVVPFVGSSGIQPGGSDGVSRETPPPPYVDCEVHLTRKEYKD